MAALALFAFGDALAAVRFSGASIELAECEKNLSPVPYPDDYRCGALDVFENRTTNSGRKILLFIVVAPAKNPKGATLPPLFFLNGGPGDASSPMAPFVASLVAEVNQSRDLVFVDLRGTGRSNPLACERIGPEKSLQRHRSYLLRVDIDVEPCVEKLMEVADLTQYNTTYAATDYNEVRAALGYQKMALIGGSYGTRLGQEIIRRYPKHVDAAVLFGVAPPSIHLPSGFARSFQNVLDTMLANCAANTACSERYPNLAALPGQISAALEGNYEPIVQIIAEIFFSVQQRFFIGLNNSFVCAEDLPFVDIEAERESSAGTVLGMYRMQQQLDTCAKWPQGQVAADFHDPLVSDVPVLLMTGANDPVTPPSNGDLVARTLSRSLHAVFKDRGHQIVEDPAVTACFVSILTDFLATSSLDGLDIGCASQLEAPPAVT